MEKIVKSLLAGDLEMPLSHCVLRQCGGSSPIVYEGSAFLMQEPNKSVRLRMFAAPVEMVQAFERSFKRDWIPGVLLPDPYYYDFEGVDTYGAIWKANRISIDTEFGSGVYVRARPMIFEKTEQCPKPVERPGVVAFLPGKVELPWHRVPESDAGRLALKRFEGKGGSFEWRVDETDEGAWLTFKCEDSAVEDHFELFLRGLSILTGRGLKPICLSIYEGDQKTIKMLNRLHEVDTAKLLPPIVMQMAFAVDAHLFLERFMIKALDKEKGAENPCELAHRYWHRILRARESDIENSSLVLSVAVEGVVKITPPSERGGDPEFIKQIDEAIPILNAAKLGSRVLGSVLSHLKNAKNPKVKDTLQQLKSEGVISEDHFEAWKKLRNAAVHGDVLEYDDTALQKHLDRFHVCLDLYYRLVFLLIGYQGRHTDYGTRGWPTREFRSGRGGVTHLPANA